MSKEGYLTRKQKQVVRDEADAEVRYEADAAKQAIVERDRAVAKAHNDKLAADDLRDHMDAAQRAYDDAAKEETAPAAKKTFWQRFKDYLGMV